MSTIIHASTFGGFNILSAFATALFGGIFALIAIVFKQRHDFESEKNRYAEVLKAEMTDIAEHFARNIKRLDAMISVLRDRQDLWPERLHIQKLSWPQDTAFFSKDLTKYFDVKTANNIGKFRLRLRNANIDIDAALRIYDMKNTAALLRVLEYVRERSLRLKGLAPEALRSQKEPVMDIVPVEQDYYRQMKDMIFLSKKILSVPDGIS